MAIHLNDDENDYSKIADEINERLDFGADGNDKYDQLINEEFF